MSEKSESESTTEVSGGGAISDEELRELLDAKTDGTVFYPSYVATLAAELIKTRSALDASEARAEAAERERDRWEDEALARGWVATQEKLRADAADAVVEAAREASVHAYYDSGGRVSMNKEAFGRLDAALAAYDQPQPTPSPGES